MNVECLRCCKLDGHRRHPSLYAYVNAAQEVGARRRGRAGSYAARSCCCPDSVACSGVSEPVCASQEVACAIQSGPEIGDNIRGHHERDSEPHTDSTTTDEDKQPPQSPPRMTKKKKDIGRDTESKKYRRSNERTNERYWSTSRIGRSIVITPGQSAKHMPRIIDNNTTATLRSE